MLAESCTLEPQAEGVFRSGRSLVSSLAWYKCPLTKRAPKRGPLNWEAEDSSARKGNCQSDLSFSLRKIGLQG